MLDSGLPIIVGDDEMLLSFICQRDHYALQNSRVKYSAFIPSKKHRNKSVFRNVASADAIRETWNRLPPQQRPLKAGAAVAARDVRDAELDVLSDEPPLRHANIEGWFWDDSDDESTKAKQKVSALAIADRAQLILLG
ncbi:MAG: hypothetical protein FGM32_04715 [Candidatus Kapabacteria bacterium]|nr:hypothetical protein [Candidatus Kapabacteria bacterium]